MRAGMTSLAVAAISVVLGSCAEALVGSGEASTAILSPPPALTATAETTPAPALVVPAQATRVELTKDELAMDCKKLRGRMHILMLELRADPAKGGSEVARTLQQSVTPIFGGGKAATEATDVQRSRQRMVLDAYNKRLVEKGCTAVDIEAELKAR